MPQNTSRGIQTISLLILGGALLFDLPMWFGLIGLILGVVSLFMPGKRAG